MRPTFESLLSFPPSINRDAHPTLMVPMPIKRSRVARMTHRPLLIRPMRTISGPMKKHKPVFKLRRLSH